MDFGLDFLLLASPALDLSFLFPRLDFAGKMLQVSKLTVISSLFLGRVLGPVLVG